MRAKIFVEILLIPINLCFTLETVNITDCTDKKCLNKCCPEGYIATYRRKSCVIDNGNTANITLPVFDLGLVDTGKKLKDVFVLSPGAFMNPVFKKKKRVYESTSFKFNVFLTETGLLYLESPNAYRRWTPVTADNFCIDTMLPPGNSTSRPRVGVWAMFSADDVPVGNAWLTTTMIISCVFLVIVLIVYILLPELRNIGGMVLMGYTFSVLFAFIFLMVVQGGGLSSKTCVGITMMVYFFLLSSFCWMNIMSFDIWWTFRGYAKARPIHRKGEKFKFLMYCLYAWGLPLAMDVALITLNFIDLSHLPWFVTPKIPDKGCFLEGGEKFLYLSVPMLIMIILNWLFFLMTAFNIWRLSRGTAVLDSAAAGTPAAHRAHRRR